MGDEPAKNPFQYAQSFLKPDSYERERKKREQQFRQIATTGDVVAPPDLDPKHASAYKAFKRHGIDPEKAYEDAYRPDYAGYRIRDREDQQQRGGEYRIGGQAKKAFTDDVLRQGLELAQFDEAAARAQGRARDPKVLPAEIDEPEKASESIEGLFERLPANLKPLVGTSALDRKVIDDMQQRQRAANAVEAKRIAVQSGEAKPDDLEVTLRFAGTKQDVSSQYRGLAPTGPAAKLDSSTGQEGLAGLAAEILDFGGKNQYFGGPKNQDQALQNIQSQTNFEGHDQVVRALRSPFSQYTGLEYSPDQIILPLGQTADGKIGIDVLSVRHQIHQHLLDDETASTGTRPANGSARYYELAQEAQGYVEKWAMQQRDVPLIDRRSRKDRARAIVRGEDWTAMLLQAGTLVGMALWAAEATGLTDALGTVVGIDDLSGKINTAYYGVTAPVRAMLSSFDTFLPGGESLEQYRYGETVENIGQGPFSWFLDLGAFTPIMASLHNAQLTGDIFESFEKSALGATEDIIAGQGGIFSYTSDLTKSFAEYESKDWLNLANPITSPGMLSGIFAQSVLAATGTDDWEVDFWDWVPFLGELPNIRLSQLANVIPALPAALFEPDALSLLTFGTGKVVKAAKPLMRAQYVSRAIDNLETVKKSTGFLRGEAIDPIEDLRKADPRLVKIVVQELATTLEMRGQWAKTSRDATSPIAPSIPGHMRDLVERLGEAEKQAGDIDALTNSLNEAVTSIKSVFDAIAEEEVAYKLLQDYILTLPNGQKILENARNLSKSDATPADLPSMYQRARNAAGNIVPSQNGKPVLQVDYDIEQANRRIREALARTTPATKDGAYNPDQLLFLDPMADASGDIKVSHFDFDEQFDVASADWANDVAGTIAGTEYFIGPIAVTVSKGKKKARRAAPTPGTYTVPPRTANNENYQVLESYISDLVGGYSDSKKDALRAVVGQEELPKEVLDEVKVSIRLAREDGRSLSARAKWIQHALRKALSAGPAVSEAAEAAPQVVTKITRDSAFDLKDFLSSIKKGDVDDRLRSLWISEVEQLRRGGFFEKVDDPWDNLPASTKAIREALKERAEVLRARFDADTSAVNTLSVSRQDGQLAQAMAAAQRRIAMSKRQSMPGIKLALQKIAENGWDDFIGRGIKGGVPELAREALSASEAGKAGEAWRFITKLLKDGKLDKFSAEALETAARMQTQVKTVQDFENLWVESITRIQDDLRRGRDIILNGDLPPEPKLEVPFRESVYFEAFQRGDDGRILQTLRDGETVFTLDTVAYNKGITERYGIPEASRDFDVTEWQRIYEIRAKGPTVEITASDRALLQEFENFLQTEKRALYMKKKGIRSTAALFSALNDPTMPVSMNFWRDPAALYTTIRAVISKFKAKLDPDVARFGVVSRAVAAVGRRLRESAWRYMDELSEIQRYAQKNNLDPAELLVEYITTTNPLKIGRDDMFYAQRTIMNVDRPPWEKWSRIMREPPKKMVGQSAEDAEKNLITSDTFLNSIARMWLRPDDTAESSMRQIIRDLKIAIRHQGTDEDYTELFARLGQPEIGDVLQDYDTFVKFTYDVAQYHKKFVRAPYEDVMSNVRVANTMAVIVTSGAVLDDMVTRMIQAVGPKMSIGQANDMVNIIKGDYFRVEDAGEAMDAFLRTGIPFTQSRRLIADTNGRKIMEIYTAARKQGVAIIPSRIYEEVSRELVKFERQFDPLTRLEQGTLTARANQLWSRFMGELRQGMTTGLLFNAPHWVNTVWGDFWQMQETVGFGTASRVTGANVLVTSYRVISGMGSSTLGNIPGIGPRLQQYSVDLKKWVARRAGLDPDDPAVLDRVLPSVLETYLRADLLKIWDHRFNGTFDLGDGYSINADELRRMMAEDGVFDFSLDMDQVDLNQIIHLKTLERRTRQHIARAQKEGRSAAEIEAIQAELADIEKARAMSETFGRMRQQIRQVPGQRKVAELWDFSRDIARESMQHFQQRQRAALYMDMLRKTKSRDQARQTVARALYDWNHGLTPLEMQTFSRWFLFYRFTRLNLTEGVRKLLGPFTEFEEGLELADVVTGQTRLSRTQDQLELMDQFQQQVAIAQGDPIASNEKGTQDEFRKSVMRQRPPDYFKWQHGFIRPEGPGVGRFWMREFRRRVDSSYVRLPEMSTVQQFEALSHVTGLLAYVVGSVPGDNIAPGRTLAQTLKDPGFFIADQMVPGISRVTEAAVNSFTGDASFNGSRPLSPGQEVMYREALRALGGEGYLTQINDQGRLGVPQFLHLLLSNIPYVSSQGRRAAEAAGANPGRDYDEWAANAFKIMVGLRPSPYSAVAEYDKRQKDAARALEEMLKAVERRPSARPALGYPYNLDD